MKYAIGVLAALLVLAGGWYLFTNNQSAGNYSQSAVSTGTLEEKIVITTSFYPLEFISREIVGDLATVNNIGKGQDPHDFRPDANDIKTMLGSDLVVLQGSDFEPWASGIPQQLHSVNIPLFIATNNLELLEFEDDHNDHGDEHDEDVHDDRDSHHDEHKDGHGHDDHDSHKEENPNKHDEHGDKHHHDHGEFDPHVWHDLVLFGGVVEKLAEQISAIDPENANQYQANADNLRSRMDNLHKDYTQRLSKCQLDQVITSHDAFQYVANRYGFEIHSIGGLSTQDTPSATVLAELKKEAEVGISAILLEKNSISAYGETLARETGLDTLNVHPIAFVEGSSEDYFTLMRSNLDTFATALQCNE